MNSNLNVQIDISKVIGIVLRKAFEFKKYESFNKLEFDEFWNKLQSDEEFLDAYKNIIKVVK